ncbi:helix-turn-helix domain-containing protein [Costertonia aggregata]|uniref:Helix-turn-helix transcriptional regulator n=1 Tax=Costertonia aggregata TaxID=343403 RepID=A0A7H9ASL5_9FLAO|nr:AraC family transcriptional regulator [Costertonia aggregata]QLG46342.1 helix-turn-helix transcriptional regulator [Costertonia aggregata]
MGNFNIMNIIGIVTILISSLLAIFLFTLKTKNSLSNRLFAVFLVLIAFDIAGWVLPLFFTKPTNFTLLRSNLILLQLPVFYLHALSVCYSDFKLKKKQLLHSIPFILVNLLLIPRYYLANTTGKIEFLKNSMAMYETQFFYVLVHVQIVAYIVVIFIILKKTRTLYVENYANSDMRFHKWLFQITVFLSIFHGIAILKNIFKFSDFPRLTEWAMVSLGIIELIILFWYLFKALQNPELLRRVDSKLRLIHTMAKPSNSNNTEHNLEEIQKLRTFMKSEEPFLDPTLTVKKLANDLQMPVRELSILINHTLNQHFFDFVNGYRVEKAKKMLANAANTKLTVLEILYEVGFNSKSSFNTAFKKHTGSTPTIFRKQFKNQ